MLRDNEEELKTSDESYHLSYQLLRELMTGQILLS